MPDFNLLNILFGSYPKMKKGCVFCDLNVYIELYLVWDYLIWSYSQSVITIQFNLIKSNYLNQPSINYRMFSFRKDDDNTNRNYENMTK